MSGSQRPEGTGPPMQGGVAPVTGTSSGGRGAIMKMFLALLVLERRSPRGIIRRAGAFAADADQIPWA
jgi:hypothetical protein